ncbi:MAG: hypothetical protein FWG10_07845 [Eubacteriaceae bacterium]|nr:hypothetical protein [Eubacteriaceae bacterium]
MTTKGNSNNKRSKNTKNQQAQSILLVVAIVAAIYIVQAFFPSLFDDTPEDYLGTQSHQISKVFIIADGGASLEFMPGKGATLTFGSQAYDVEVSQLSSGRISATIKGLDSEIGFDGTGSLGKAKTREGVAFAQLAKLAMDSGELFVDRDGLWYSMSFFYSVLARQEDMHNYVFKARISGPDVFVAVDRTISEDEAGALIKELKSIYTFNEAKARQCVQASGNDAISRPEIDQNKKYPNIYYYHFHTYDRNGAHAWYGSPHSAEKSNRKAS